MTDMTVDTLPLAFAVGASGGGGGGGGGHERDSLSGTEHQPNCNDDSMTV